MVFKNVCIFVLWMKVASALSRVNQCDIFTYLEGARYVGLSVSPIGALSGRLRKMR